MQTIIPISAKETYLVRQEILRPGLSIDSCIFTNDNAKTTFHLGYFIDNNLTGVVSVFLNSNDNFITEKQYQIRGMAILKNYQKNGIGKQLVLEAEKIIIQKQVNFIWFNARESAVDFYKKLGYHTFGTRFDINGVGPHFLMYKHLESV